MLKGRKWDKAVFPMGLWERRLPSEPVIARPIYDMLAGQLWLTGLRLSLQPRQKLQASYRQRFEVGRRSLVATRNPNPALRYSATTIRGGGA